MSQIDQRQLHKPIFEIAEINNEAKDFFAANTETVS
jgi:hypothetical protein